MVTEMKNKVNILGTEYVIKTIKISECEMMQKEHWAGCCCEESKEILVGDLSEKEYFPYMTDKEKDHYRKKVLRHEITHAFFNESGLSDSASIFGDAWAKNEEMIDWFAIQSPKIFKAFQEVSCL